MRSLIAVIILCFSLHVSGFEYHIETINIESQYLNEDRVIQVFYPDSLANGDSVSFIYLLDGEFAEDRYKKILEELPNKQLVGIGINSTHRNQDLLPTKQPDFFLAFLFEELLPRVEKGYYIKERILFGHSFAGGFVINTMLKSPGAFTKYIASSPTPIMDFVDAKSYIKLDKDLEKPIRFYFSYGSKDLKQVIKWSVKLKNNISGVEFDNIFWKNEVLVDRNHNDADLIAIMHGMSF